ncbi:hypothetical protein Tco_1175941 [Tanacetum coccineum]
MPPCQPAILEHPIGGCDVHTIQGLRLDDMRRLEDWMAWDWSGMDDKPERDGLMAYLPAYAGACRLALGAFQSFIGTDNQEKDKKQRQNDKTGLGMEKTVKDKAKSKPESQSSQKVNRKVNWSKSKSTQVNPGAKVKEI